MQAPPLKRQKPSSSSSSSKPWRARKKRKVWSERHQHGSGGSGSGRVPTRASTGQWLAQKQSLDKLVEERMARRRARRRKEIAELLHRKQELSRSIASLRSRIDLHRRLLHEREVSHIDARVAELRSGKDDTEYVAQAQPLLKAYDAAVRMEAQHHRRTIVDPGRKPVGAAAAAATGAAAEASANASASPIPSQDADKWYNRTLQHQAEEKRAGAAASPAPAASPVARGKDEHLRTLAEIQRVALQIKDAFVFFDDPSEAPPRIVDQDRCEVCNATTEVFSSESLLVCPECSTPSRHGDVSNSHMSFGDDMETHKNVYKRTKRFRAVMEQFLEGTKPVPDEVLINIKRVYEQLHIRSCHTVRPTPVKTILKLLNCSQYIDYAARITRRLNNRPIPSFTREEIETYLRKFEPLQDPFLEHKSTPRTNFPNNSYVVHRLSDEIEKPWFKQCFPLLKSRAVMKVQDSMWRPMVADRSVGWKYKDLQ